MSPHKHTANVLDAMLRGRDLIQSSVDISLSLEEFAMGINLSVRDLDLCWGYVSVEPQLPENHSKETVISLGVAKQSGDLVDMPTEETGLSLSGLLDVGGAEPLQNVYAFGSIYLQANTAPDTPNVVPLLLRGGSGGTGRRLLLNKQCYIMLKRWRYTDYYTPIWHGFRNISFCHGYHLL